jgi:NAD(P)-dependent dehydrogenase (short-subunit alcohol dehydrogenase family)
MCAAWRLQVIRTVPAKRAGTPDEVASVVALLMGRDGAYITGSDVLIDGGVTATYWFGEQGEPAD